MMKCYIMLLLALLVSLGAAGQRNHVYIEDFEVSPDSTVTVPVILVNQDSTYGFQFNLKCPPGLKVKTIKKTAYTDGLDMNLTSSKNDDSRVVLLYSMEMKAFPPDSVEVLNVTFRAESGFRGGDILIWRCFGSKCDTQALTLDGGTTHVARPAGALFGLPEDASPAGNGYFDTQGQPDRKPANP